MLCSWIIIISTFNKRKWLGSYSGILFLAFPWVMFFFFPHSYKMSMCIANAPMLWLHLWQKPPQPPHPMKMIEMYLQLPTFFIEFISLGCLPSSSHPDKKMSLFQLCKAKKNKNKGNRRTFSAPIRLNIGKPTATDVTLAYTTLTTRTDLWPQL